MKRWDLRGLGPQVDIVTGQPVLTARWHRQSLGGDLHHLFAFKLADPFDATSTASVHSRLLGHLILDQLPDEALLEVLDLLGNAWSFYQPSQPEIEFQQKRVLKGKVGKRYERPTYSLPDEE